MLYHSDIKHSWTLEYNSCFTAASADVDIDYDDDDDGDDDNDDDQIIIMFIDVEVNEGFCALEVFSIVSYGFKQ